MTTLSEALAQWDKSPFNNQTGIKEIMGAARRADDGVHIRYCTYHESRVSFGGIICQVEQHRIHDSSLPLKLPNCDVADYLLIHP